MGRMLHGMRLFLLLAVLPPLAFHGGPAAAQPRCTPAREGEVACFDGKLCECRYDPGGTLTGRRPGTRWNCDALRPSCGGPAPAEAGQPPAAERAPPSFFPPPYPPAAWR
jgi:hypothetical protein